MRPILFMITVRPDQPSGGPLTLVPPTYDCQTGAFQFNTTGGDGSPVEYYAVPGITGWTGNPNQLVDRETRTAVDAQPIILRARQHGNEVSYVWDIRAVCPINSSTFSIASVNTIRCQAITATERQLTFTPQYSGLSGEAVSFSVVNELSSTLSLGPYTLRVYTDNPVITLSAQQGSSVAHYNYNWLAVCNTPARLGLEEASSGLAVKVLGNPVTGRSVEIEINGASSQLVQLMLTDLRGKILYEYSIKEASSAERVSLPLGGAPGMLLLNVCTATQRQQVKLLRP